MKKIRKVYKVTFFYLGKVYTLYAKSIEASSKLITMCEISEIIFKKNPNLIIPSDEETRAEFSRSKILYIPLNNVLRVDDLEDIDEKEIEDPSTIKAKGDSNLIRPVEFFR